MDRFSFSEVLCTGGRDNPSQVRKDDAKLSAVHKNYPQIAESRWLLMASVFNIALLSHIGTLTCLSVLFFLKSHFVKMTPWHDLYFPVWFPCHGCPVFCNQCAQQAITVYFCFIHSQ